MFIYWKFVFTFTAVAFYLYLEMGIKWKTILSERLTA